MDTAFDTVRVPVEWMFGFFERGRDPLQCDIQEQMRDLRLRVDRSFHDLDWVVRVGQQGAMFVRFAGLSGAAAVVMGAYGSHAFRQAEVAPERKRAYDTGNRYHLLHSAVLLAVPLSRRPRLSGALFLLGTLLFSGPLYHYALTNADTFRKMTPYGGIMLIAAWLSLCL